MNTVSGAQQAGGDVGNVAEQCRSGQGGEAQHRAAILSTDELFRLRMESQCHQIKRYRLEVLRESGRLLSSDEAAMEWIARFAATFDNNDSDPR
ncbi:MAG: hypothetical protein KDI33_20130 [Halioglobus sp.]|nr:hypothetical protein [Halioglobus sp.]